MFDVFGVVWTIVWAVLKYPIGLVIIFFGAVAIGLQCLVGNQGACSTFPHTFFELLRVAGICLLGAGVLFALWRPRLVMEKIIYFFAPELVSSAMNKRGVVDLPLPAEAPVLHMANEENGDARKSEIMDPAKSTTFANDIAPTTVKGLFSTAFWHVVRFRVGRQMLATFQDAVQAHTKTLQAETENFNARVEHQRAQERFKKDLPDILETDRVVARVQRSKERMRALFEEMQAADEIERFTAAKSARGKRDSTKPRSYGERFERHFSTRGEIYAARDNAIRKIIERAKTQGRDESHPEVEAEIEEARQYAEELISKLRDQE